ncbi:MAG: serine/threonine-protein kinase [Tahibacter sp.]
MPVENTDLRADLRRLLSAHERTRVALDSHAADLAGPLLREGADADARLAEDALGRQFGAYRLTGLLGVGGMGLVYLAERADGSFSQQVALKVVQAGIGASAHERFERERQILAGLAHPNIAALYDGGELADGQAFYTMEYVDGVPITQFCLENHCNVERRIRLLRDVANALSCAHRNLVVHRDIKPSNILVTDAGQVKLLDFGIAKLLGELGDSAPTRTHAGPMTPDYAAPEQFRTEAITIATDIYQFGVLCFRLLTGALPYRADPADTYAWARAVAEQEPISLVRAIDAGTLRSAWNANVDVARLRRQLGGDLEAIVAKALAKSPADRYGSMDALNADLDAFLQRRPVSARKVNLSYTIARFALRHRYAVASATIALLLLCATAVIALRQAQLANREAERANAVAKFLVGLFQVSDPGVNRGEKLSANQILERGATRLGTEMSAQPEQRARLLTVIGDVYSALGDFARAKPLLQSALAIQRALPERDAFDTGHTLRVLGWVNHRQGDPKTALALLDEASALLAANTPRVMEERAAVTSYRGLALKALGDFAGARTELERAMDLANRAGVGESPGTAAIHNNLGLLLRDHGDPTEARAQFETALAIYRREFGEDHYRTIGTTQNLAMLLLDLGDRAAARPLLENTNARNLALFGDASADYANAQNMLGNIDRTEAHYDAALQHYAIAERAYRAALGDKHPNVAFPIYNAGELEMARGDVPAALARFDQALALRLAALPPDHPEVAESLAARSRALLKLQRYAEAEHDAARAVDIRRAKLAPDHTGTVQSLLDLGLARYAQQNAVGAKQAWDEALERGARAYVNNAAALAILRNTIAHPEAALQTAPAASAPAH